MKESKEVRDLRGKILGMEMELNILSKDLERFKIELSCNEKLLQITEDNIEFLKKSRAAVSLPEFRKIRQQRELAIMRIKYYKTKIQPLEQIVNRKDEFHRKEIKRFEEVYREQFKNNILQGPWVEYEQRREEA